MNLFPCVAITGGIAEGKSTILAGLAKAGYRVASADDSARDLFSLPKTQQSLAGLLSSSGVTRERLRDAMLDNAMLRRRVNRMLHAPILVHMLRDDPQFVEIPLLIEDCLHPFFRATWVVTCGAVEQRNRLIARVEDESLAAKMLSLQLPTRAKIAFADRIVRTNEPEEAVNDFVIQAARTDLGW